MTRRERHKLQLARQRAQAEANRPAAKIVRHISERAEPLPAWLAKQVDRNKQLGLQN